MNRKSLLFIFFSAICWLSQAKNISHHFFVKDVFEKNEVSIHYSAVVQIDFSINNDLEDNSIDELSLKLYLSSFYVDYIVYQNKKIKGHQLFGYTFPAEMLAVIDLETKLFVETKDVTFNAQVSSYRPTIHKVEGAILDKLKATYPNLKTELVEGKNLQFKILETTNISFPKNKDFFQEIPLAIENSIKNKNTDITESEKKAEYLRLLTEGNLFLNENNYNQAYKSFVCAKRFATDLSLINSKIDLVAGLLTNSRNSNFRWQPIIDHNITDISPSKNDIYSEVNGTTSGKLNASSSLFPDRNHSIPKHNYHSNDSNSITTNNKIAESAEVYKPNNKRATISENSIFVTVEEVKSKENSSVLSEKQLTQDSISISDYNSTGNETNDAIDKMNAQAVKEITSEGKFSKDKKLSSPSNSSYSPFEKKGFIKYKRDSQAVVDDYNRLLIPFGKYEILRYRAGFANVKIKDSVALKKIECTGENGEYTWSARIYQNPWQETVVDKNGKFVDDFTKKVEIYVVDNVTLVPYAAISAELKNAFKDPNPYADTDFISAFKLWERENAKRPEVIHRRAEIKVRREVLKREAYQGADACKATVSKSLEEVVFYFKHLGYEIIDRNSL